jgi:Fe-S-cluster-containing dehydrogenase component
MWNGWKVYCFARLTTAAFGSTFLCQSSGVSAEGASIHMEDTTPTHSSIQVDATVCRGCQACALACSLYHEGECGPSLSRVAVTKWMSSYEFGIAICRHCKHPACVEVCSAGALSVDRLGFVMLDEDVCTRCGSCVEACPYDAIFHNLDRDRFLKCDTCVSRAAGPVCVEACPSQALELPVDRHADRGSQ